VEAAFRLPEASTVEAGTGEQEASAANRGSSCEGWLRGATEDELSEEFGRRIEFGAIIASCVLLDCVKVERIERGDMDAQYPFLRDARRHCNGPWCWILGDVKRLVRAIPCRGAQGLWSYGYSVAGEPPVTLGGGAVWHSIGGLPPIIAKSSQVVHYLVHRRRWK
jgi:hypothetical protein